MGFFKDLFGIGKKSPEELKAELNALLEAQNKSMFKKKTPEELKAELEALVKAQKDGGKTISDIVKEFFANNNAEANKKVREYFWNDDCSDLLNKGYIEGNFWFTDDN